MCGEAGTRCAPSPDPRQTARSKGAGEWRGGRESIGVSPQNLARDALRLARKQRPPVSFVPTFGAPGAAGMGESWGPRPPCARELARLPAGLPARPRDGRESRLRAPASGLCGRLWGWRRGRGGPRLGWARPGDLGAPLDWLRPEPGAPVGTWRSARSLGAGCAPQARLSPPIQPGQTHGDTDGLGTRAHPETRARSHTHTNAHSQTHTPRLEDASPPETPTRTRTRAHPHTTSPTWGPRSRKPNPFPGTPNPRVGRQ